MKLAAPRTVGGIVASLIAAAPAWASSRAPRIPLCPGLTVVTAISQPEGDYESIKRLEAAGGDALRVKYSSELPERRGTQITSISTKRSIRVVPLVDFRQATSYLQIFERGAPQKVPGTTAIGTSSAVLEALKTTGAATLGIFTIFSPGNTWDYEIRSELSRTGYGSIRAVVNGASVRLPTVQAAGDFDGEPATFEFLDDERNALALRFRIGRDTLDVVRISFDCSEQAADEIAARTPSRIERGLASGERIDVYDLFFSFNSAELRDESAPTLREIGDIMRRHPQWRLAIGGHTDNVASTRYNLELSQRRAAAVKQALVTQEGIDGDRFTTAGYGEGAPRESNDTLEGRALNRRVELMRLP